MNVNIEYFEYYKKFFCNKDKKTFYIRYKIKYIIRIKNRKFI